MIELRKHHINFVFIKLFYFICFISLVYFTTLSFTIRIDLLDVILIDKTAYVVFMEYMCYLPLKINIKFNTGSHLNINISLNLNLNDR